MKRDKYSMKIHIAIILTVLFIVPAALGISMFLKDNMEDNIAKEIKTEIQTIIEKESEE